MRSVAFRFLVVLLLVVQGLNIAAPVGLVVCVNPTACNRPGTVPVWMEPEEDHDACCDACACRSEATPAEAPVLAPFSAPCDCCVSVPLESPLILSAQEKDLRDLELALRGPIVIVAVPALLIRLTIAEPSVGRAWSLPPPDSPVMSLALGLTSTRLLI